MAVNVVGQGIQGSALFTLVELTDENDGEFISATIGADPDVQNALSGTYLNIGIHYTVLFMSVFFTIFLDKHFQTNKKTLKTMP